MLLATAPEASEGSRLLPTEQSPMEKPPVLRARLVVCEKERVQPAGRESLARLGVGLARPGEGEPQKEVRPRDGELLREAERDSEWLRLWLWFRCGPRRCLHCHEMPFAPFPLLLSPPDGHASGVLSIQEKATAIR